MCDYKQQWKGKDVTTLRVARGNLSCLLRKNVVIPLGLMVPGQRMWKLVVVKVLRYIVSIDARVDLVGCTWLPAVVMKGR